MLPLLAAENVYKEDRLLAFSSGRGGSDLAQIEGETNLKNMYVIASSKVRIVGLRLLLVSARLPCDFDCLQGITKETFPGFVRIRWLCFPLCLRLVG